MTIPIVLSEKSWGFIRSIIWNTNYAGRYRYRDIAAGEGPAPSFTEQEIMNTFALWEYSDDQDIMFLEFLRGHLYR